MKKSFGLRAAQIRQLGVAESVTYRRDMPSIRLLDLTNLVMALASKHFFNGLLADLIAPPDPSDRRPVAPAPEPNPYLKTKVMTAGPAELRLMLFDGALKFIEQGRQGLVDKDYEAAFTGISRCQQILAELVSSLDPKHAPDLCERLTGLYTFMITRLMVASHERDPAIVEEVIKLLQFERETWVMLLDKLADEVAAASNMTRTPELGPGRPADGDAPPAPGLIGGRVSYQG